jgi:hypothetical protein
MRLLEIVDIAKVDVVLVKRGVVDEKAESSLPL